MERRDSKWLELPKDLMVSILSRLTSADILSKVQLVCQEWRRISRHPLLWETVDMRSSGPPPQLDGFDFEKMCRHAINRSCGSPLEIVLVQEAATDRLLHFIGNRASQIKRLRLISCTFVSDSAFIKAISKLTSLEELDLTFCSLSNRALVAAARYCRNLRSLSVNRRRALGIYILDSDAFAIAHNMPELRRLQLVGNRITDQGLQAVLDGCPRLESLDLRRCHYLNFDGSDGPCGIERIKHLKFPGDPMEESELVDDNDDDDDGQIRVSDDESCFYYDSGECDDIRDESGCCTDDEENSCYDDSYSIRDKFAYYYPDGEDEDDMDVD